MADVPERYSPDKVKEKLELVFNPREGELDRVLSKEELILLCKRKKCVVEVHRWNPIFDFYLQMMQKPKHQNKPLHKVQKILKKLGNHYKDDPKRLYSREIIEKEKTWEWEMRKCFNVRWLDENKENSNEPNSTREEQSFTDSSVIILSPQSQTDKTIDLDTPAVPTYMNHMNFNPTELESHKGGIFDSENLIYMLELEENTESSNEPNATREEQSFTDSSVIILSPQTPTNKTIDLHTPAVPTYMNHINFNLSAIEGHKDGVLNSGNWKNMVDNEKQSDNSVCQLEEGLENNVSSESVENVLTESEPALPILLSQNNSKNYNKFRTPIHLSSQHMTSTQES